MSTEFGYETIDPGHIYRLLTLDGDESQMLQFVRSVVIQRVSTSRWIKYK